MRFEIHPAEGVGPVRFGMTKDNVRSRLGPPNREFVRGEFTTGVEWIYGESEAFVAFDVDGKCESIMLCHPASAFLDGVDLLGVSGKAAFEAVRRLDADALMEDDALTSRKLGIAVDVADVGTEREEEGGPPNYVLVCRGGYLPPEDQAGSQTFLRIKWRAERPPDEPHVIYCELNADQLEVRKVEVFSDLGCGWASADESSRSTRLSSVRTPALRELKKAPRFAVSVVTKSDFERVWSQRTKGWPPRAPIDDP